MEFRDLYDEFRNPIFKTIKKGEKPKKGEFYVTVVIVIEDMDGRFLIQKRSLSKGGLWATTGGHPKAGESSLEGILTEVKEEMGLDLDKNKIVLFDTIKTEDDFVDYYYIKCPIDEKKIVLQKEEVSDYAFKTKKELFEMFDKKMFHSKHEYMMKKCFAFLENGGM